MGLRDDMKYTIKFRFATRWGYERRQKKVDAENLQMAIQKLGLSDIDKIYEINGRHVAINGKGKLPSHCVLRY